jgi:hypothetical protein
MINWKLAEDKVYPDIDNFRRVVYKGNRYKIIIHNNYVNKSVYKMVLYQPITIFIGIGFNLRRKKKRGRSRNK